MYLQLQAARANNDKDESLQKMIEDFNELRTQLSQEMNQENGDQQKLQQLDTQVPALYQDIMDNETCRPSTRSKRRWTPK